MVTIKDIAAKLDVSPSTVGRALADDKRISAETKIKVRLAAEDLGYVSNRSARMMRGVSSNLVGLMVPDIRNSFYSTIAHALSQCLIAEGFQLTLCETGDDPATEYRHVHELASVNVAGIILVPCAAPQRATARILQRMPHVQLLRNQDMLGAQWFGIDDVRTTYEAARHVAALGHRRIAYIGGSDALPTGAARLKGFRDALAVHGLTGIELLGAPSSLDFGREAMRRLRDMAPRPTAVVMGAVQNTTGVLEEMRALGLRAPEDLSVVGFGDEPGYSWWGPGLTTMQLPVSDLATSCALWFLHRIKTGKAADTPYVSLSSPTLVTRGSTAAVTAQT